LNAILDLIASFLVALAGGGGAFAFSYEHPGRSLTLWRGEHSDILEALADDWKTLGRVKEPAKTFDGLARERVENEFASTFEGVYRTRNGASVYLGLIGKEGGHFRKALAAPGEKSSDRPGGFLAVNGVSIPLGDGLQLDQAGYHCHRQQGHDSHDEPGSKKIF
jgi:hypothetical protein